MKANIAKLLYETYCAAVGGKAFNGDPLPAWDEFVADEKKKLQSDAWLKVAEVVPLALLGEGMFSNRITAEKIKHLCESGMVITGIVATKLHCPQEEGLVAIVDKGAVRWLKKDEAWDLMHNESGFQLPVADWKLELEKLSLAPGDIVLITIPKDVPMTPQVQASLANTFTNLVHDKGVRVLLKNADIAVDVLAELLTADDIAKLAARLEQKQLEAPVAPVQSAEPVPEKLDVILNGHPAKCDREVTYEQIVVAAGYQPDHIISVTYYSKRNGDSQRSGILSPGKKVLAEEGMIFNAVDTSNA